jgi:hypothetical protein
MVSGHSLVTGEIKTIETQDQKKVRVMAEAVSSLQPTGCRD